MNSNLNVALTKDFVNQMSQQVCSICFSEMDASEVYEQPCKHQFCRDCMLKYVETRIGDRLVHEKHLTCPDFGCNRPLTKEELKSMLPPEIFGKYEKFVHDLEVTIDSNTRWCPKPGCKGVIRRGTLIDRVTCSLCQESCCFQCGESWHPLWTCSLAVDMSYNRWKQGKNVKPCPKCGYQIEKESGCNHMNCSRCHYEFCWLCGIKYSSSHYANLFSPTSCSGLQYSNLPLWGWGPVSKGVIKLTAGTFLVAGGVVGLSLAIAGAATCAALTIAVSPFILTAKCVQSCTSRHEQTESNNSIRLINPGVRIALVCDPTINQSQVVESMIPHARGVTIDTGYTRNPTYQAVCADGRAFVWLWTFSSEQELLSMTAQEEPGFLFDLSFMVIDSCSNGEVGNIETSVSRMQNTLSFSRGFSIIAVNCSVNNILQSIHDNPHGEMLQQLDSKEVEFSEDKSQLRDSDAKYIEAKLDEEKSEENSEEKNENYGVSSVFSKHTHSSICNEIIQADYFVNACTRDHDHFSHHREFVESDHLTSLIITRNVFFYDVLRAIEQGGAQPSTFKHAFDTMLTSFTISMS